ncbi:DUF1810 domain-containing protein [Tsuneonella amylolytica]|uniref:DUF1810 domain-containing protein n=1 Tax=Tsuneonella amylolytica TaxID=2338327 RepID=UPI000EA947FD|nr:DUF1810 domain-containing protein [Tsuneonella amylolytica]
MSNLDRFVQAQAGGVYETALDEIRDGAKRSHWMWYIFPQVTGLGRSAAAQFYGIDGRREAEDYLSHSLLGSRLHDCTLSLLALAGKTDAVSIFGSVDAMKLRSSMTLFEAVAHRDASFRKVLEAFFDGERDQATLDLL